VSKFNTGSLPLHGILPVITSEESLLARAVCCGDIDYTVLICEFLITQCIVNIDTQAISVVWHNSRCCAIITTHVVVTVLT